MRSLLFLDIIYYFDGDSTSNALAASDRIVGIYAKSVRRILRTDLAWGIGTDDWRKT